MRFVGAGDSDTAAIAVDALGLSARETIQPERRLLERLWRETEAETGNLVAVDTDVAIVSDVIGTTRHDADDSAHVKSM